LDFCPHSDTPWPQHETHNPLRTLSETILSVCFLTTLWTNAAKKTHTHTHNPQPYNSRNMVAKFTKHFPKASFSYLTLLLTKCISTISQHKTLKMSENSVAWNRSKMS
jgi:hypothetical protein